MTLLLPKYLFKTPPSFELMKEFPGKHAIFLSKQGKGIIYDATGNVLGTPKTDLNKGRGINIGGEDLG